MAWLNSRIVTSVSSSLNFGPDFIVELEFGGKNDELSSAALRGDSKVK